MAAFRFGTLERGHAMKIEVGLDDKQPLRISLSVRRRLVSQTAPEAGLLKKALSWGAKDDTIDSSARFRPGNVEPGG